MFRLIVFNILLVFFALIKSEIVYKDRIAGTDIWY